jgi:hypothetical protein
VNPHLDFYPVFSGGKNVLKMSQSFKWREDLSTHLQVQMDSCNNKHWYIFEPVELKSKNIVVPLYFFMEENVLKAQCVKADIQVQRGAGNKIQISIPSNIAFASMDLRSVDVRDFSLNYLEIHLNQFGNLAQACSYELLGELSYSFILISRERHRLTALEHRERQFNQSFSFTKSLENKGQRHDHPPCAHHIIRR